MTLVDVLIFRGVPTPYTYLSPEDLSLSLGDYVCVPLASAVTEGLVVGLRPAASNTSTKLKTILESCEKYPKVSEDLIKLIVWFAEFYQVSPYKAYQSIVGKKKTRKIDPEDYLAIPDVPDGPELSDEQATAINTIQSTEGYAKKVVFGVTASGKTEIYLRLCETIIKNKKQAIICIPEIALTPQFTEIFSSRFGQRLAILHSGLTPKQKEVSYSAIALGHVDIIVGPRSAIFAPVQDLGLIVIDEAHESTYKQDNSPRYDTTEVAEFRAKTAGVPLILGSATPGVESFYESLKNKDMIQLKKRINNRPLPKVTVIDMREKETATLLSPQLIEAITKTIEKKEKALILVNRRGYSTHIQCSACATILECPRCKLSLTYHKSKALQCHRCHIKTPLTHHCPKCGKRKLSYAGIGIQKVEIELKKQFLGANIVRLDRDAASTAKKLHENLSTFKNDGDILIGTQMIAKGHHIAAVTLVGVVGIDSTLNIPDFRSPERTFQLLTQVAGRAGRGDKPGQVLIQAYNPAHYAIKFAAEHNFEGFYAEEIVYRETLHYPPFTYLIHILVSSKYDKGVLNYVRLLHAEFISPLQEAYGDSLKILGPKPAPIEKINDHLRWHVLLKVPHHLMAEIKEKMKRLPPAPRYVKVIKDFDPRSLI